MKWKKVFECEFLGLKCDNPNCNYENNDIEFSNYGGYLNQPCPLCGEPLLTEKDWNVIQKIKRIEKILGWIRIPCWKRTKINGHMDGSGKINWDFKSIMEVKE